MKRILFALTFVIPALLALYGFFTGATWPVILYLVFSLYLALLWRLMYTLSRLTVLQRVMAVVSFAITVMTMLEASIPSGLLNVTRPVCLVLFVVSAILSMVAVMKKTPAGK